jgi:hypothetical protein
MLLGLARQRKLLRAGMRLEILPQLTGPSAAQPLHRNNSHRSQQMAA